MSITRIWLGAVFVGLGAVGILGAAGAVDSGRTIDEWWPVAVIGWAAARMLTARNVSIGSAVVAAVGVALLADAQQWAADAVVWPILISLAGIAILLGGEGRSIRGRCCLGRRPAVR